jgi:hypothetical protein
MMTAFGMASPFDDNQGTGGSEQRLVKDQEFGGSGRPGREVRTDVIVARSRVRR